MSGKPQWLFKSRQLTCLGCLAFLLLPVVSDAQNLVTNGGFESYNACLASFNSIAHSPAYAAFPTVQDWVTTTSDYYNRCAPISTPVRVPYNAFGYQEPHAGNDYAGFYTYFHTNADYREYLRVFDRWGEAVFISFDKNEK